MSLKIHLTRESLRPDDVILVLRPKDRTPPEVIGRRLARVLKAAGRHGFHNIGCRDAKYGFPEIGLAPVRGADGCTGPGCPACIAAAS